MKAKILVIGGTYFLGKAFLECFDNGENDITVLNRGSRLVPGNGDGHIRVICCDRQDREALQGVKKAFDPDGYDCIVDFCAYGIGDIRNLLEVLPVMPKQYLYISTCDVYRRGSGRTCDEDSPLETRDFGGEAGAYICGKAALEEELRTCADKMGFAYTSVRPTIIYGPDNYAPREGIFFHWIMQAGQVLYPEDADGTFQMVYVKDLARCIVACICNTEVYDTAINVCGETVDYARFIGCLGKAAGQTPELVKLSVKEVEDRGIPLPFPLTGAESESYSAERAKKLGVTFTALEDGLRETYEWFLGKEVTL